MIVVRNSIYVPHANGYVKCVLHKCDVDGRCCYYLATTKVMLDTLPAEYDCMTMDEIVAKYGVDAVDDDADAGTVTSPIKKGR